MRLAEADAALLAIAPAAEGEDAPAEEVEDLPPVKPREPEERPKPRRDLEEEAFDKEMAEMMRESIAEGMQRRSDIRVLRAPALRQAPGEVAGGFSFLSRSAKAPKPLDLPEDHPMLSRGRAVRNAVAAEEEQERQEIKQKILSNPEYGGRVVTLGRSR